MIRYCTNLLPAVLLLLPLCLNSHNNFLTNSQISGNTEIDAAYYVADSKLGITNSSLDGKYIRMNGFMELNYQFKNFSAGIDRKSVV